MVLTPTPKQQIFHDAVDEYDQIGFGGGRGPGKSMAGCHEALRQSIAYPGNKGAILRRDLKDLRDTTFKTFRDDVIGRFYPELRPYVHHRQSPSMETTISFPTWRDQHGNPIESLIMWGQTKDADSWRSANLAWGYIDESTEVDEDFYLMFLAALGRHTLPDYHPRMMQQFMKWSGKKAPEKFWWSSNPGPGWCKKRFPVGKSTPRSRNVEIIVDGEVRHERFAFIPALARDNPHLPENYEAKLRAQYPAIWVRRWLDGDWDAFEGQVFDEFDPDKHVLKYPADCSNRGWTHFLTLDWGFTNPAAALISSVDFDGHWWFWKSHYKAGLPPEKHAPYLREMLAGLDSDPIHLIDPAAVSQETGRTIAEQFNALPGYGFHFWGWPKKKNGPDGTIMFMKRLMAEGKIHISPVCEPLIEELTNAKWAEQTAAQAATANKPEIMQDKDDHAIDAAFGALQWWRTRPERADDSPAAQREARREEMARVIEAAQLEALGNKIRPFDPRTGQVEAEFEVEEARWGM